MVRSVGEDEDAPEQFFPLQVPNTEPDLPHLTAQQVQKLRAIIPEGMFSEQPVRTAVVEHNIQLKESKPVRQRMYRIPKRFLPALKEELEAMKQLGVVEHHSGWCSPVVLVPKKDIWEPPLPH